MKYSIIVPVHNSEKFMRRCLDSIKMQTVTDYELIVVCDRCSDSSEEIAREYADKVVISDWGNDGSRQEGLDVAEGEWVLFLDDDDWWLHEYVLAVIDEEIEGDILCFGFVFKGVGCVKPYRFVCGRRILWPSVWSKCYRREFIQDVRFNSISPTADGNAADIDWTQRVLAKRPKLKMLDQALYYYDYLRAGSQTVTKVRA